MIKFDSNYIGNQHTYFHLARGVQGLRVTILSVKGTKNEGVPLPFFQSETYEVSFTFAYHLKKNDGAIHIPSNVVVHGIVVKARP